MLVYGVERGNLMFGRALESRAEVGLRNEGVGFERVSSPPGQVTYHLELDSEPDVVTHLIVKNGGAILFSSFKGFSDRMSARPLNDPIRGDCQVLAMSISARLRVASAQVADGHVYASAELARELKLESKLGDALLIFRSDCLRVALALSLLEGGRPIPEAVESAMNMGG